MTLIETKNKLAFYIMYMHGQFLSIFAVHSYHKYTAK